MTAECPRCRISYAILHHRKDLAPSSWPFERVHHCEIGAPEIAAKRAIAIEAMLRAEEEAAEAELERAQKARGGNVADIRNWGRA